MKIIVAAVAALTLASSPATGQSSPQPTDTAGVAEYLLYEFCLPLFDGRDVTSERLAEVARGTRLVERDGRWLARLGQNSGLILTWNPENRTCQMTASGTGPVADAFLARLEQGGWGSQQRGQPALEGGQLDLLCGRPSGADGDVCVVVRQPAQIDAAGTAMNVTVIRAP